MAVLEGKGHRQASKLDLHYQPFSVICSQTGKQTEHLFQIVVR